MNYFSAVLLTLLIFGIIYFLRRAGSPLSGNGELQEDEFPDLNKLFLDHTADRQAVELVKIFNPSDQMILRSMLAAEDIDSYVKSNLFGDLYGSSQESIFSTTIIEVFEDCVPRAKVIVQDYILNLRRDRKVDNPGEADQVFPPERSTVPSESDLKYIPELLV